MLPINSPYRKPSKSGEVDIDSEHRAVHFTQMVNEGHLSNNDLSASTSSNPHPLNVSRKVSFSDLPLMSNSEERQLDGLHQSLINTDDKFMSDEDDDSGHHIEVHLLNPDIDEMPILPPELKNTPIFEVKLGMLKQATVYRTEFTIPDNLKSGELEILRTVTEMDGHVSVPVNVGASFTLLSCEPIPSPGHGHIIVMEISTTKQPRVNELITLRRVETIADSVCLLLHGISLAKGQGTPLLRSGIHRITENQDYIDSDDYTEWPGYVNIEDDDVDDEEEEEGGKESDVGNGEKAKAVSAATENIDVDQGANYDE